MEVKVGLANWNPCVMSYCNGLGLAFEERLMSSAIYLGGPEVRWSVR